MKKISFRVAALFGTLFLLPMSGYAAEISLRATPPAIGVGDTVQVSLLLDSTTAVNAFSGTLVYPTDSIQPIAVSDGNSIVNIWLTRPSIASTTITFAGITPGGFSGNNGILFSVLFKVVKTNASRFSVKDIEVLRNDGNGGNEATTIQSLLLSPKPVSLGGYTEPEDTIPPESFMIARGTDPQLFDTKTYIVFSTVDKGSGIGHYAVAESRVPRFLLPLFPLMWNETLSPYMLVNQDLTSTVYVKAVDRMGNERISSFPPLQFSTLYEMLLVFGILLVFVLFVREGKRRFFKNP